MHTCAFRPGINTLTGTHRAWIRGMSVGLVTHAAALDARGTSAAELLDQTDGVTLKALFAPEHGLFGALPAGKQVPKQQHPSLNIPVYSLYGNRRRPHPASLRGLQAVVFDLQDLGARPYTYVATMRNVMQACADAGIRVIVADRPVPLPDITDGPMLDPTFESFVASIPAPMAYGMTPGETAHWLRETLDMDLDLKVARMAGYARDSARGTDWPPWLPPSPGIRSWESACCYLSTVFCEAVPNVDNGRGSGLAFQVFGAPWMDGRATLALLQKARLPGVRFERHPYVSSSGQHSGRLIDGIRLVATRPHTFRPVTTSIHIIHTLMCVHGQKRIWGQRTTRPDFFDKLYGTDEPRRALVRGESPAKVVSMWRPTSALFRAARRRALLYQRQDGAT